MCKEAEKINQRNTVKFPFLSSFHVNMNISLCSVRSNI
jgi:hypothetical protein